MEKKISGLIKNFLTALRLDMYSTYCWLLIHANRLGAIA